MVDTSWPLVYTNYCIIIIIIKFLKAICTIDLYKSKVSFMIHEIESEFVSQLIRTYIKQIYH